MSVAQTAHSQFEQAYQLVAAINLPLARSVFDVARELLRDGEPKRHLAEQVQPLRMRSSELEHDCASSKSERLLAEFCTTGRTWILTNWKRCIRSWKPHRALFERAYVSQRTAQALPARQEQEQLRSRVFNIRCGVRLFGWRQNKVRTSLANSAARSFHVRFRHRIPATATGA